MTRWFASFLRDERGVAGAEMALVTPLLVIIMFGCFELGNYFWNEHIVVKSVRDAARFAGRQSFTKYSCTGITDATVESQIRNLARTGAITGGTALVRGWTSNNAPQVGITVSCNSTFTGGIYNTSTTGAPVVTVSAVVPYQSLFNNLGFTATTLTLRAESQAAVMGI